MSEYELTLMWLRVSTQRLLHESIKHADYWRLTGSRRYALRSELAAMRDDCARVAQMGERIQRWLDEWDSEVDEDEEQS